MTSPIGSTSSTSSVHQTQPSFGPSVTLMSPDDILAYVTKALDDIGGQLENYKDVVAARQEKAGKLREITAAMREMNRSDGMKGYDQDKYAEMMTKMSTMRDDPNVAAAYDAFMISYGGYVDTKTGNVEGTMAGTSGSDDQDMFMDTAESAKVLKFIEDAQGGLNSDNELVMMNLQQLMQRRNQITQFSSNAMNVMNEGTKSIIGNIR